MDQTENAYKRIGKVLTGMREKDALDWILIADTSRPIYGSGTSPNMGNSLSGLEGFYQRSKRQNMSDRVEILLEKDTLANVVVPVTREYDVPLVTTRGYWSHTLVRELAVR